MGSSSVEASSATKFAKLIGTVLENRYRLDALIGSGGMGAVFTAWQIAMEREVAVKVIPVNESHIAIERFNREKQAIAHLSHPNIIQAFDSGKHDDWLYLAMKLVRGI